MPVAWVNGVRSRRSCGSTRSCCRSPAAIRSGRATTRRRPVPSRLSRTTSTAWTRRVEGHPRCRRHDRRQDRRIPGHPYDRGAGGAEGRMTDGVRELTKIPGLGPKRALQLSRELDIHTAVALDEATKAGPLDSWPGSARRAPSGSCTASRCTGRATTGCCWTSPWSWRRARVEHLRGWTAASGASYEGSLRRMRETIGDVDILAAVATRGGGPLMAARSQTIREVAGVIERPTKHDEPTLRSQQEAELQVDLRVVTLDAWGAALQYFTGSPAHNVAIRQIAVRRNSRCPSTGCFTPRPMSSLSPRTEQEVYAGSGWSGYRRRMREDRARSTRRCGRDTTALSQRRPAAATCTRTPT